MPATANLGKTGMSVLSSTRLSKVRRNDHADSLIPFASWIVALLSSGASPVTRSRCQCALATSRKYFFLSLLGSIKMAHQATTGKAKSFFRALHRSACSLACGFDA